MFRPRDIISGEVAVDIAPMEKAHYGYGVVFHDEPKTIIADADAIVGAVARQAFDIREVVERGCLLKLLNHGLKLLADGFCANLLEVPDEALPKDNLHRLPFSKSKTSSRLTASDVSPSLIA